MKKALILILISTFIYGEYIKEYTNNTVLNTNTLQMWQDDSNCITNTYTWIDAINYCSSLNLAGFNDWRLPNINELNTLVDDTRYAPSMDNIVFEQIVTSNYWSGTSHARSGFEDKAWRIEFQYGKINYAVKTSEYYVRCVRDFK
jgi:hypothetical protein